MWGQILTQRGRRFTVPTCVQHRSEQYGEVVQTPTWPPVQNINAESVLTSTRPRSPSTFGSSYCLEVEWRHDLGTAMRAPSSSAPDTHMHTRQEHKSSCTRFAACSPDTLSPPRPPLPVTTRSANRACRRASERELMGLAHGVADGEKRHRWTRLGNKKKGSSRARQTPHGAREGNGEERRWCSGQWQPPP